MVLDRKKCLAVVYDWRNRPSKLKFYDAVPVAGVSAENATALDELGIANLVAHVDLRYDALGNRVLKQEFRP
jgi:hypothetical protein